MYSAPESIAVHALMALGNDENKRSPPFFFNTLASQRVKRVQPPTPPLKKSALKKQHRQLSTSSTRACMKPPAPLPHFLSAAALDQTRQELLLELNRQALLPLTVESSPVGSSDPWSSERVITQHLEWQQKLCLALTGCSERTQKAVGPAATHLDPLGAAVWLGSVRARLTRASSRTACLTVCMPTIHVQIQRVEQLDQPVRAIVKDHRERSQLHLWRNPAVRRAAMQLGAKRVLQHIRQHPTAATAA